MKFNFSEDLNEILRRAGWFPERSVDVTEWIMALTRAGYVAVPGAKDILQSFGNLVVVRNWASDSGGTGASGNKMVVKFDPMEAIDEFEKHDRWQKKYSINLFPIADINAFCTMLLGNNGQLYAGTDIRLRFIGRDFESGLANTFVRRQVWPVVS